MVYTFAEKGKANMIYICIPLQASCMVGRVARAQDMSKRSSPVMSKLPIASSCRLVDCSVSTPRREIENGSACVLREYLEHHIVLAIDEELVLLLLVLLFFLVFRDLFVQRRVVARSLNLG